MINLYKAKRGKIMGAAAALFIALNLSGFNSKLSAQSASTAYESKTAAVNTGNTVANLKLQTVKVKDLEEFTDGQFMKKVPLQTDKLVFNTFFFKPRQILQIGRAHV